MGGGFKILVSILWQISTKNIKDKIILMEEPDRGMHPGYIGELIKILIKFSKDKNVQFFITTHNTDFIEAFFNKKYKNYLKKNFSVLRMEIDNEGYLTPQYLNYDRALENKDDLQLDLRGI